MTLFSFLQSLVLYALQRYCGLQDEGQEHMHDDSVISVGIELEGNLDMNRVNKWLSTLLSEQGVDLFRSKGILAIEGSDDK